MSEVVHSNLDCVCFCSDVQLGTLAIRTHFSFIIDGKLGTEPEEAARNATIRYE